ncbi:Response regulator PleD [compost metagenome]
MVLSESQPIRHDALTHRLTELSSQAESPETFVQGVFAALAELGLVGCMLAARPQTAPSWKVFGTDAALVGEAAAALVISDGASLALSQGTFRLLNLPMPARMRGYVMVREGASVEAIAPLLPVIGNGLATQLLVGAQSEQESLVNQLTHKLRALKQVSHQINNTYDLQELSASLCSIATATLGAQYAGLYLLEDGMIRVVEDLAVFKSKGLSLLKMLQEANARTSKPVFPLSQAGFLEDVIRTGKPVAIADLLAVPERCPQALLEHQLASVLATPLVTQREILGLILVGKQEAHVFTEGEQELLADLAQQTTGAFVTSKLFNNTVQEKQRADRMVEQLKHLNVASADVGKTLNVTAACQELLAHLPNFMVAHWQAIYLLKDGNWTFTAGSTPVFSAPPVSWLEALEADDYPASLELTHDLLAGTPFVEAGRVTVFPLRAKQELLGLVIVATETATDTTGRELVETLVGHTALSINNATMLEQVERLAITDGLTGLYNRRYFNSRLETELQRSQRFAHPVSLIILDIDYFKVANDVLGHLGGDAVLKQLAVLLREKVRKVDIVARYGGEEFAIILPETTATNAAYVAEKIRNWIEEFPFTDQERLPHRNITSSLGVASFPEHAHSLEELIHRADDSLYRAKEAGRNQVGRLPEPIPPLTH